MVSNYRYRPRPTQLRAQVARMMINLGDRGDLMMTVSVGVTCFKEGDTAGEPETAMMARADAALYRAKNSGRNRVELET